MDEGQNAIIALSPVNSPLKNLFLVFILKLHFIPLKQIPSQKDENKKTKQTKNPNQWKPTNQPTKFPKTQTKKLHQTQSKTKTKLWRQLLFSQCHLVTSGLSSITLCVTSLSLQGFSCFNCRQSFALTYIPAHISLIIEKSKQKIQFTFAVLTARDQTQIFSLDS